MGAVGQWTWRRQSGGTRPAGPGAGCDAGRLVDQYGATRIDHFTRLARVVADLPKLKAAVETGDPPTVQPLAEEYRSEVGADLLILTGRGGTVLLAEGVEGVTRAMPYGLTSPPAIYRDLVICGFSASEGDPPGAPGDVRAFDVRTGKQAWRFRTVPRPGELGGDSWPPEAWKGRSGVNPWGGLTVDEGRGIVFCGTGSAAHDWYGGDRKGDNLFANCALALDAGRPDENWTAHTIGRWGRSGRRALVSPLPDDDARTHLRDLVAVMERGQREPLPLPVRTSGRQADTSRSRYQAPDAAPRGAPTVPPPVTGYAKTGAVGNNGNRGSRGTRKTFKADDSSSSDADNNMSMWQRGYGGKR